MTNIHHNNYALKCDELLKELAEAKRTISDNNEFFAGQMMSLNDRVTTKDAEIAMLRQELKGRSK